METENTEILACRLRWYEIIDKSIVIITAIQQDSGNWTFFQKPKRGKTLPLETSPKLISHVECGQTWP